MTELAQRMAAWEEEDTLGRPHLILKDRRLQKPRLRRIPKRRKVFRTSLSYFT